MIKQVKLDQYFSFFSFVSKAVIILPILILVFSLFFKFNQPKKGLILGTEIIPTPTPTKTVSGFKFDLNGPIVCDNLFIQNKKVLLKDELTNYLLNGDCLYTWEGEKSQGVKKCGLTSYLSLVENYLGLMNIDDLINNDLIKDKLKNKDIDLAKVIKSCKRGEIGDKTIFKIPKNILFKTKQ